MPFFTFNSKINIRPKSALPYTVTTVEHHCHQMSKIYECTGTINLGNFRDFTGLQNVGSTLEETKLAEKQQ